MSLIHKALKKAEGADRTPGAEPPIEEFVGKKPQGLRDQLTPRTIVLLGIAVLALIFMLYKKIYYKKTALPTVPAFPAQVAVPQGQPMPEGMPVPVVAATNASAQEVTEEGKKLYGAGKYDEALAKFLEADMKSPNDPEVFNNIGLIYKKKNDLARAESFYKKALQFKPNYPECLNNLGVLRTAAGDPLEAAIYLKKAITLDSTYAAAYFNLAVLNDSEGNFREAINNYKSFLQYTDTKDDALIQRIRDRIEELSE